MTHPKSKERLKIEQIIAAGGIKKIRNKYYDTKSGKQLNTHKSGPNRSPRFCFMNIHILVKDVDILIGTHPEKLLEQQRKIKQFKVTEGSWAHGVSRKYTFMEVKA